MPSTLRDTPNVAAGGAPPKAALSEAELRVIATREVIAEDGTHSAAGRGSYRSVADPGVSPLHVAAMIAGAALLVWLLVERGQS